MAHREPGDQRGHPATIRQASLDRQARPAHHPGRHARRPRHRRPCRHPCHIHRALPREPGQHTTPTPGAAGPPGAARRPTGAGRDDYQLQRKRRPRAAPRTLRRKTRQRTRREALSLPLPPGRPRQPTDKQGRRTVPLSQPWQRLPPVGTPKRRFQRVLHRRGIDQRAGPTPIERPTRRSHPGTRPRKQPPKNRPTDAASRPRKRGNKKNDPRAGRTFRFCTGL